MSNDPKLLACPLEDLATRMQHAGWTHDLVVDGDLECATGMACAGPVCAATP